MKKSTFLLVIILLATNILKAAPAVIYVNDNASGDNDGSCWADAFTTLQAALDYATAGDQIWIAAGTYYPTSSYGLSGNNNRYLHFRMKAGVKIYGGFAGNENPATFNLNSRNFNLNTTILSGDVDVKGRKEDNSFHVIYHPEGLCLTGAALLDGVTVTDGYASGGGEPENTGGGICNIGSSPTFSNVIITGNFANIAAGMYNDCSSPNLYKVSVRSNSATACAGIYNINHSLPRLINVDISNNSAQGMGAVVNINSSPQLADVTISNNNGGGIDNIDSNPVLINSIITGNTSSQSGGGIYNKNSSPELTNVTICGNSALYSGGGLFNKNSSPALTNVTISDNIANLWGGGLYNENSSPVLNNCIIWGNNANTSLGKEIFNSQSVVTLNHCCYGNQIYGDATVVNNCITSDPKFVYPVNGDYRICGNSLCVNAGKNEYNNMSKDLRGKTRIQNDTIDIGAYEWANGTDPLLFLKDITVYLDSLGNASVNPSDLIVETSSAIDTLTDMNSFDCSNLGDNEVEVTLVVDNKISICDKAIVTVLDTIPPVFSAPPDTTIYTVADCRYNADVQYTGDVTDESDACGSGIEASYSDEVKEGDCPGRHIISRTWRLEDNSGNSAVDKVQIIYVSDTLAPQITENTIEVYLGEDGKYSLTNSDIKNISAGTTDNCTAEKDLDINVFPRSFQCVNVGEDNTVTVTAVDLCGNMSSLETTITVSDTIVPVAEGNPIEVYLRGNGQYVLTDRDIEYISAGTKDNCTSVKNLEIDVFPRSFQCVHAGQDVDVEVIATDLYGNRSSTWTTVSVRDSIAPKALCTNTEIFLDDKGEAIIFPYQINTDNGSVIQPEWSPTYNDLAGGSFDVCGISGMYLSQNRFDCSEIGENIVTLTVSDPSGNSSTCTTIVTIIDTITPEIEPVANISIMAEPRQSYAEIDYPEIIVTDNCGVRLEQVSGLGQDGLFPIGTTTETWSATDGGGNTAIAAFTVTVTTINSPPNLVNPVSDQTVHAGDILKIPFSSVPGEMFVDYDDDALTLTVVEAGTDALPEWAIMQADTLVCKPMQSDTGCVNIAVIAEDASGNTAADTFSICIDDFPVFTDYLGSGVFEIQMYPNPTKDLVKIDFSSGFDKVNLSVMDMTGKVVLRKLYKGGEKIRFNMAEKISGIYLVKLDFDDRQVIKKLVVNKTKY